MLQVFAFDEVHNILHSIHVKIISFADYKCILFILLSITALIYIKVHTVIKR